MIPKWLSTRVQSATLVLLFLSVVTMALEFSGCAKQPPRNLLNGAHKGSMVTTISTCADSNGVPKPVVIVSIPHSALIFQKQGIQIEAGLEVTVSAFSGGELVGGGVATQKTTVGQWDAIAADSLLVVRVPLNVPPATKAILEVRARSLHSSRFWVRRLPYDAGPWLQMPLALLEFNWVPGFDKIITSAQDSLRLVLSVKETSLENEHPTMEDVDHWWVVLKISNTSGSFIRYHKQHLARGEAVGSLALPFIIPATDLPFGDLTIAPLLWAEADAILSSSSWQHEQAITSLRINFSDTAAWKDQLGWLEGKAPESVLTQLAEGPAGERKKRWDDFWKNQSPLQTPGGQGHNQRDHLLLIVEADRRYTRGNPGSYSARGKAMIQYGIPDRIDKVGDSTRRNERWETWIYQLSNLKLIFQDPHGLGDFMLVEKDLPRPVSE